MTFTRSKLDKLEEFIRLIVQDETANPGLSDVGNFSQIEQLKSELIDASICSDEHCNEPALFGAVCSEHSVYCDQCFDIVDPNTTQVSKCGNKQLCSSCYELQ